MQKNAYTIRMSVHSSVYLSRLGYLSIIITFVLMCITRLWYTMFLLFAIAVLTVLTTGRNSYCGYVCPLGKFQDYLADTETSKSRKLKNFSFKYIFIAIFWAAVIYSTFTPMSDDRLLWVYMLRIMLSAFAIAIVSQLFLGKRFFCINLCPLRIPILSSILRIKRRLLKTNK
ncbi:MAG: 4Fe-4S binding protein [Deltaproteobacteria bacterium]|nr:4Fe-4S binding protein [Deltaproteobacteria bacterium]